MTSTIQNQSTDLLYYTSIGITYDLYAGALVGTVAGIASAANVIFGDSFPFRTTRAEAFLQYGSAAYSGITRGIYIGLATSVMLFPMVPICFVGDLVAGVKRALAD